MTIMEYVQEIVQDLEESGREAGLTESPSRIIKEELIEREETSRESRKVGDEMVSNESTEEVKRIVIEDSVEGESYMIRTVGQEEGTEEEDEPVPHKNVLTPDMELTPLEGHEQERGKLSFRPLIAPKKKMLVPAVSTEIEPDEDENSCSGDSSASRRSPLSAVSSGRRRMPENEVPLHL